MTFIIAISIALLLTAEASSVSTFGRKYITESCFLSIWLDGEVRLNPYSDNIISKFPDDSGIRFVTSYPLSPITKWHIHGEYVDFRVVRFSKLHKEIEAKHKELTQSKAFQP